MNNLFKARRITSANQHSLLRQVHNVHVASNIGRTSLLPHQRRLSLLASSSISSTSLPSLPSLSTSIHSTILVRTFASMQLGEIRAQARDEHLKDKIFSDKNIKLNKTKDNYAAVISTNDDDTDGNGNGNGNGNAAPSISGDMNIANDIANVNDNGTDIDTAATTKKPKRLSEVPISAVLKSKHTLRWVEQIIDRNSTVRDAITVCIDRGLSGMMVIDAQPKPSNEADDDDDDEDDSNHHHDHEAIKTSTVAIQRGKVVGMATSRDLLRIINSGLKAGEDEKVILNRKVGDYMTPITQVIYARPEETIGMCRRIMGKLGVKCLPILSNGRVEGLITARDMSDFGLDAAERGGKKHYLENKSERVGMSTNTSMAEPPAYIRAHLALQQNPLYLNVGYSALPHPYKTPESCGINRRDYGPEEVGTDNDLSEDAHFICRVSIADEPDEELREVVFAGVADGVGSWREYGVDPREFSHSLMQESHNILREADAAGKSSQKVRKGGADDEKFCKMLTPAKIMGRAFDRVKADNIIGSATACIAMFDGITHQLNFSNLGDSGIIVLRHIDSDVAGALKRNKTTPRTERTSDLRVAFVSQQQLRSFNHPFQLGWTGKELNGEETSFKNASESCTTSIHIRRGDIIILATDGLFDNVELEDITKIALEWEQNNGFIVGGDIASREKRWRAGSSMTLQSAQSINELAKTLVDKARENSLDSKTDSPFALLAKDNDIMWSGGMPDDCTIVAMHVVGAPATEDGGADGDSV